MLSKPLCLFLFLCLGAFGASHRNWDGTRTQIETTLHVANPLPNVAQKSYGSFNPAEGVTADRVSYSTAYEMRIPAIVYHPAGATITKHPALVIVNGHQGDKSSWYAYYAGILYARAGAVVLTYDPLGEYERNKERRSRTSQHDEITEPEEQIALRTTGAMVTDVLQAVSYLGGRRDVDPKRIGVLGFSMGSLISALSCALDTRINACVLAGGGNLDGPGQHWDHAKPMCESTAYKALSLLGDRGAIVYALNAQRGPTLVLNGSADTVEDIPHEGEPFFADLRTRAIRAAGSDKNIFEYRFFAGGGHAPYFLTKDAALWLNAKLKFPEWTKKQIESLPETKVDIWAKTHLQSDQGKNFAANEGSLVALGDNVPAVPRPDLHAIPEALWDSQNQDYVYETWLDRAKTAVQTNAP